MWFFRHFLSTHFPSLPLIHTTIAKALPFLYFHDHSFTSSFFAFRIRCMKNTVFEFTQINLFRPQRQNCLDTNKPIFHTSISNFPLEICKNASCCVFYAYLFETFVVLWCRHFILFRKQKISLTSSVVICFSKKDFNNKTNLIWFSFFGTYSTTTKITTYSLAFSDLDCL